MPTSQVVVLPIFGSSTGTVVTSGTVTPNYPAHTETDALLVGEWWPASNDPFCLIDIISGLPNTLLPVGQYGDATFPTLSSTVFSIPAGKNGLVLPYDDVAASTIMLVVKRPTTTYGDIVGNYSDISGSTSDGVHIYWTSGTVYCDMRAPANSALNLNAPSQGAIGVGDYVFIYLREDATGLQINFGGSANAERSIVTGYPRTISARKKSIGNRYINNANYITNVQDVAWVGYVDSKLTTGQISTIYTAVKALLLTAGVTVK